LLRGSLVFHNGETLLKKNSEAAALPCGLLRHLAIMIYDAFVVISLLMLATMLAMLAGFGGRTAMRDPVYTAYLLVVWFLYLAWCWHRGGMTIGMRAWRVKIEDIHGHRPGWIASLVRFGISLISAAFAGLGFLWPLFNADKRTWHDMVSRTRLVKT
jgi:uncharacterized RDD family membrane protein YckC